MSRSVILVVLLFGFVSSDDYIELLDNHSKSTDDSELNEKDGYKDADANLLTPDLIAKYGYPSEAHVVKTFDDYLLTLHRIPYSKNGRRPQNNETRPIIFLQHGLLGSSADWVIIGPERGLAYLLADTGYDVWMGNVRGNTYSRSHVSIDSSDEKFWDFSFHEMGLLDLPAEIDYILNTTNQKELVYIGHSMGTTMFYVLASTRPEYKTKIRAMFSLAPVAYMSRVKSPIRLLAPFSNDLKFISQFLGKGEFLPQNKIMKFIARYGCDLFTTETIICENAIFSLTGYDKDQFNQTLLPVILGHTPAGASTKTLVHYAQEIESGKFGMYDYGRKENQRRYGSTTPPEYNISAIQVPISLHYSENDWLANVNDVDLFFHKLPNPIGKYLLSFPKFNHVDFLWAIDIKKLLYNDLMNLIHKEFYPNITSSPLTT